MALALACVLATGLGIGVPSNLMGSAPREQQWTAPAADIRVIDGDTLRLGDRTLRLHGLEAPGRGLSCTDRAGHRFDCGAAAADALARLVAGRDLDCRVQGRDRFGRALGTCAAGGIEVNAALVSAGWALADDHRRRELAAVEAAAREAGRGLWAGVALPEAWRERPR